MSSNGHKVDDNDLEQTLERGAIRGSVEAAKLLLRLRRKGERKMVPDEDAGLLPNFDYPADHPWRWTTPDDPFLPTEPELWARLSEAEKQIARDAIARAQEEC